MTNHPRSWWQNCASEADAEIMALDRLEDRIAPLSPEVEKVRALIGALEMCHHKADRWLRNIIAAIGGEQADKGLGTRATGRVHPAETVWQQARDALEAWCEGRSEFPSTLGGVPASVMLDLLGDPTPLKQWQIGRVIDKIDSTIAWPAQVENYAWLLLCPDAHKVGYVDACPEAHRDHEAFWLETARTLIDDTLDGERTELSLALAIDMLWPCHWRFVENLRIVLAAIGGDLHSGEPFSACGRNIGMLSAERGDPIARVIATLRVFAGRASEGEAADPELLNMLGQPTEPKQWLVGSLEKTIRLQIDPPVDMRAACAMSGPEWLRGGGEVGR